MVCRQAVYPGEILLIDSAGAAGTPCSARRRAHIVRCGSRTWTGLWLCSLGLLLGAAPLQAQTADAARASGEALDLGAAVTVELQQGDVVAYTFDVAAVGRYRLMPGALPAGPVIHASLAAGNGLRLFDTAHLPVDVTLPPDRYTLTFQARDDVVFDFVLVRHAGRLATREDQAPEVHPGQYLPARPHAAESFFALLRIPPQPEAREWFLHIDPPDGQSLQLSLAGPDLTLDQPLQDLDTVSFWSAGGTYRLRLAEVAGETSPLVAFFSSGQTEIVPLYLNSQVAGVLPPQRDRMLFRLAVSQGFLATFHLTSDYTGDLDLEIQSISAAAAFHHRSATPLPAEAIENLLLAPGTYLVTVDRRAGQGPAEFTLALQVDPVRTLAAELGGTVVAYQGEDELLNLHVFDVTRAGQTIEATLAPRGANRPTWVFGRQRRTWERVPGNRVVFVTPTAGPHYLGIETLYGFGEYELGLSADAVPPLLARNGFHAGTIAPSTRQNFRLRVLQPASLISIILISRSDQDLDLETNRYDAAQHTLEFKTSAADPKVEAVAWYDPPPGYLLVSVLSFGTAPTEFLVVTQSQPITEQ